ALCVAALPILWRRGVSPPTPTLVPLTSLPGNAFRPTISPDGKRVAFVWDGGSDNFDIYVKLINTGDPLRLTTNPESDTDPAWSPDGARIAFRRTSRERSEILVVPALGGSERKIAVHSGGHPIQANAVNHALRRLGPAWSPDGQQIAMVNSSSADEPDGIYLVSVETGEKRR